MAAQLNVAVFAHPTVNRMPCETLILVRASFARLFGRVMLFWMAGCTMLNPLWLLPFAHLQQPAWRLAAIAFAIQALVIPFSLVGPLPINNRVIKWTPQSLHPRLERASVVRISLACASTLIVAFALLIISHTSLTRPEHRHSTAPPARVAA